MQRRVDYLSAAIAETFVRKAKRRTGLAQVIRDFISRARTARA